MKRRQFLGIACASTVFANACKKDDPTPTTTVQGTITDAVGNPVVGLEVEYSGRSPLGSGIPVFPGGSGPDVSFSEKTLTDRNGFFKMTKVVPEGIALDGTQIILSNVIYQKFTTIEVKKNGIVISDIYTHVVIVKSFEVELGKVNEYLVTLK